MSIFSKCPESLWSLTQFHALQDGGGHFFRKYVGEDVDGICLGFGRRRRRQQNLQKGDHVLRQVGEETLIKRFHCGCEDACVQVHVRKWMDV